MIPLRQYAVLAMSFLLILAASCGAGPRTKWLVTERPAPLPPNTKVDVFVGKIDPPYQQIAIIETGAVAQETDQARLDQLEELRRKAREAGANAIQDVKILQKRIKGVTPDEKVPFKAWQQGRYTLYFMRGMAINVGERPGKSFSDVEPLDGWAVSKLPVPPPLPQ